jgi:2,4-dienoyl-CoA reductase-like NADH-dependent reductase (Old Yellow Enzyme family)
MPKRTYKLLSAVTLGELTAKNRVVLGPHRTNLAHGRRLTDDLFDYYKSYIDRNVGVLVTESASVEDHDWPYEYAPLAESFAKGWSRLTKYAKESGCLVVASLSHSGNEGSSVYSQRVMVGASEVPDVESNELPQTLSESQIESIVSHFCTASTYAFDAGVEAVEINASYRSLLRQFLSPINNLRDDRFGTDRALFLKLVLEGIKKISPKATVGVRLSLDELTPWGGIDEELGLAYIEQIAPYTDYVVVTRGGMFTRHLYRANFRYGHPTRRELLREVKKRVHDRIRVVAQGSFFDIADAEEVVTAGESDLVEMTRALIADEELVSQLTQEQTNTLLTRPCLGCNQRCNPIDSQNIRVDCLINPKHISVGTLSYLEPRLYPNLVGVPISKVVHIVGAGIAGMECAMLLGRRGYKVHLYDKRSVLGGLVALYGDHAIGFRYRLLLQFYEHNLRATQNVTIHLNKEIKANEDLHELKSNDLVVFANGADPAPITEPIPAKRFLTSEQIYEDVSSYEGKVVVVIDPRGNVESTTSTEKIALHAAKTYLVTPDPLYASRTAPTGDMIDANRRARLAGVELRTFSTISLSESPEELVIKRLFSRVTERIRADYVHKIGARQAKHNDDFNHLCIATIGDARVARSIFEAISDARKLDLYLTERHR